jgi:hypothetical protein
MLKGHAKLFLLKRGRKFDQLFFPTCPGDNTTIQSSFRYGNMGIFFDIYPRQNETRQEINVPGTKKNVRRGKKLINFFFISTAQKSSALPSHNEQPPVNNLSECNFFVRLIWCGGFFAAPSTKSDQSAVGQFPEFLTRDHVYCGCLEGIWGKIICQPR